MLADQLAEDANLFRELDVDHSKQFGDKTMEALSRFSKIYCILKSGLAGIENLVPINFNNALMPHT